MGSRASLTTGILLLNKNSSYDSNVENTSKLELIIQKLELIFAKGSVSQERSRPMVYTIILGLVHT